MCDKWRTAEEEEEEEAEASLRDRGYCEIPQQAGRSWRGERTDYRLARTLLGRVGTCTPHHPVCSPNSLDFLTICVVKHMLR